MTAAQEPIEALEDTIWAQLNKLEENRNRVVYLVHELAMLQHAAGTAGVGWNNTLGRMDRQRREWAVTERTTRQLNLMAQDLCPDGWVFQLMAYPPMGKEAAGYRAIVSNGDDNVMGTGTTAGAALAHLVAALLDGAVRPLTGDNGGRYIRPDKEDET